MQYSSVRQAESQCGICRLCSARSGFLPILGLIHSSSEAMRAATRVFRSVACVCSIVCGSGSVALVGDCRRLAALFRPSWSSFSVLCWSGSSKVEGKGKVEAGRSPSPGADRSILRQLLRQLLHPTPASYSADRSTPTCRLHPAVFGGYSAVVRGAIAEAKGESRGKMREKMLGVCPKTVKIVVLGKTGGIGKIGCGRPSTPQVITWQGVASIRVRPLPGPRATPFTSTLHEGNFFRF